MRTKGMLMVGYLAVLAVTGVVNTADSFADARRVDVIGNLSRTVTQSDSMKARDDSMRVDVIGSIGSEGPAYPYTQPMNR